MKNLRIGMNNKRFIKKAFKNKKEFHRKNALLPFEEKIRIVMELQKIDFEMRKKGNKTAINKKMLWTYGMDEWMND